MKTKKTLHKIYVENYIKFILIIIAISITNSVSAQQRIDKTAIPSIDSVKNSIQRYYLQKAEAETTELRKYKKHKILRFLPSIGYDAFRQSPVITFSTSSILAGIEQRVSTKQQIAQIRARNQEEAQRLTEELYLKISQVQRDIYLYNCQLEVHEAEKQLFQISVASYQSKQLLPSEFQQRKISYLSKEQAIANEYARIMQIIDEINVKSKLIQP